MLLPKTKPIRNRKHLEFVVSFRCILRGWTACEGEIQAHHLLKPYYGHRGVGMRASDNNTVPLCYRHHAELHKFGNEDEFWKSYGLNKTFGRHTAERLWDLFQEEKNGR